MIENIHYVAKLARIHISEEEAQTFSVGLHKILTWVEQLAEINDLGADLPSSRGVDKSPLREDVVIQDASVSDLLRNAPETYISMFSVPKIVE